MGQKKDIAKKNLARPITGGKSPRAERFLRRKTKVRKLSETVIEGPKKLKKTDNAVRQPVRSKAKETSVTPA